MKPLLALFALGVLLAACATPPTPEPAPATQTNAAATFCLQSGGKVIAKEAADGTASPSEGWCQLPSGHMVDEWAFYNQAHPAPGSS